MRSTIEKIVAKSGKKRVGLGSFSVKHLVSKSISVHPEVKQYFETCIPVETVELSPFNFLSGQDIEEANTEYFPGHITAKYGLLTILTDEDGDALSVDLQDGKLYHLNQDRFELEGVIVDNEETGEATKLELSRENILDSAEGYWPSLSVFFRDWLRHLEGGKA